MSYTIEYNKQFILSKEGITPCWLAGDNNVTETNRGANGRSYERCCREWSIFYNLLGVSEQEILDSVQGTLGGFNEHWMRNGKWVDDKGLIRWIKSGCKNAAPIEEILAVNCRSGVSCLVSVWDNIPGTWGHHNELAEIIRTTEDFDAWIINAKSLIKALKAKGCSAFPIVNFQSENLRHPSKRVIDGPVLLKHKNCYLAELNARSSSWNSCIENAMSLSYEDAMAILQDKSRCIPDGVRIISAKRKNKPFNAVIRISEGRHKGRFILKINGHSLRLTDYEKEAKHYPDETAAKAAVSRLNSHNYLGCEGFTVVRV